MSNLNFFDIGCRSQIAKLPYPNNNIKKDDKKGKRQSRRQTMKTISTIFIVNNQRNITTLENITDFYSYLKMLCAWLPKSKASNFRLFQPFIQFILFYFSWLILSNGNENPFRMLDSWVFLSISSYFLFNWLRY